MVLGFKDQFKEKIISGSKIHTIREDTVRLGKCRCNELIDILKKICSNEGDTDHLIQLARSIFDANKQRLEQLNIFD